MEFWPKLGLSLGLLLIVVPATLRMGDVLYVDNSTFTAIFVIGIILLVIANRNRVQASENPRRAE